jgi:hypothetical protein
VNKPTVNRPRWHKCVEWAGTAMAVLGSIIIASNIGLNWWGYWAFLASTIAFMIVTYPLKLWAIFSLNLFYFVINVWGLIRWH